MLTLLQHCKAGNRVRQTAQSAAAAITVILMVCAAFPAQAQDTAPQLPTQSIPSTASEGLSFNLPVGPSRYIDDLDNIFVPSLELPVDAVGSTLFKLDLSNPGCLSGTDSCERRTERLGLGVSKYITAKKDSGIDLVLRPRASFRFDEDSSSALVGAVVEIGEDLRRGSDFRTNTWYFFAGADAEALTYSPDGVRQLSSGQFHLQDRIIVGDAQAGLGYRIGDADVSLSYLRREANAEGFSYNEDAAALSFTWKR